MKVNTNSDRRSAHTWRFFRSGGFDQVRIDTVDDLRHLGELDQKLWSVLACPTSGLEFDSRTLQLLDTDGDGRIRAPEVIAAARWVCAVLKDPDGLFRGADALPLAAIDSAHPEGGKLLATAQKALAYLGKPEASAIAVADLADTTRLFAPGHFNGDGIVPAELAAETTSDPALVKAVGFIVDTLGSVDDRSGQPGVDQDRADAFFAAARAVSDWHARAEAEPQTVLPLGEATAEAAAVFDAVRAKVDDYFTRCRLAAFDERAATALNPADAAYAELSVQTLGTDAAGVAALPLARAAPGRALPLGEGLNPAWEGPVAALQARVIEPLLGARAELSQAEWQDLAARFAAYRAWLAAKPA